MREEEEEKELGDGKQRKCKRRMKKREEKINSMNGFYICISCFSGFFLFFSNFFVCRRR